MQNRSWGLFGEPTYCIKVRAHRYENVFKGNKMGVGGEKEQCITSLSHTTASFSQVQRQRLLGFVPSVQKMILWLDLAVVKEVYKQMNLFLAVLELLAKFK